MDIVIISHFCMDFSHSDNDRFLYLARLLAKEHEVELITSDFYHTEKKHRNQVKSAQPCKVTFLSEPGYSKNVCFKRFYSHYVWGKNVRKYLKKRKKPNVIYCAVPSLIGPYEVAKYCEKNGVRFIIDIQDLWPEAFQMIINFSVLSHIVFSPFKLLANGVYKRADAICAVSKTYVDRGLQANNKCKEGHVVFLGTNLDTFDEYKANAPILKKNKNEIWLAYCGTLGSSYDITCVIDALALLKERNINIKFIIIGDGPKKRAFEDYAMQKHVNVKFTGRIPYSQMCSLLCICDITVNPIVHMAAGSIINKHADYAASGLPVVSTQENEEYQSLVDKYKMGFNCRNNNAADLANSLQILINNPNLRKEMGENARKCAEELMDRKVTYPILLSVICDKYIKQENI